MEVDIEITAICEPEEMVKLRNELLDLLKKESDALAKASLYMKCTEIQNLEGKKEDEQ